MKMSDIAWGLNLDDYEKEDRIEYLFGLKHQLFMEFPVGPPLGHSSGLNSLSTAGLPLSSLRKRQGWESTPAGPDV